MAANDNPSPDESFFPEQPETLGRSAAARLRIVSVLLLLLVTSFCSLGGAALAQVSADPDQLIIAPLSPAGEQAGREGLRAARSGDDVSAVKVFQPCYRAARAQTTGHGRTVPDARRGAAAPRAIERGATRR